MPTLAACCDVVGTDVWPARRRYIIGFANLKLPSFTTSSSSGMLNLLPLSAPKALPSTSGGVCRRGSPTSAIQTGIKDPEVVVCGNGGDAPKVLVSEANDNEAKRSSTQRPQQVTEIFTWIQCFASYTSVLSTCFHYCVPELMAYMVTITRVSRDFAGLAWVRYDASFLR